MLAFALLKGGDDQRFNDADLADRMRDAQILGRLFHRETDGVQRQDGGNRQYSDLLVEGGFGRLGHQDPPAMPMRSASGSGMLWIASARNRVTKCSSVNKRRRALMMKISRLCANAALRTRAFCRSVSFLKARTRRS